MKRKKRVAITGEVFYNPNWKRADSWPKPKPVKGPKPLTRQVLRQLERRSKKQPLNISQQKWHSMNQLAHVNPSRV